jgi:hypothetical protein
VGCFSACSNAGFENGRLSASDSTWPDRADALVVAAPRRSKYQKALPAISSNSAAHAAIERQPSQLNPQASSGGEGPAAGSSRFETLTSWASGLFSTGVFSEHAYFEVHIARRRSVLVRLARRVKVLRQLPELSPAVS